MLERLRQRRKTGREKLLTPAALEAIEQFQARAKQQLAGSQALVERRTGTLVEALADLKEARRPGDDSVEAGLTDLWAQVLPLFWRQERQDLAGSASSVSKMISRSQTAAQSRAPETAPGAALREPLSQLETALLPFSALTEESVLRRAAALAKRHPSDPVALAGAADVISVVVAGFKPSLDPLR
jgi:hypothetical protein